MTDLKPCPWCNKEPFSDTNGGFWCNDCAGTKSEKDWNSRPIEDRMRAALGKLLIFVDYDAPPNKCLRDAVVEAAALTGLESWIAVLDDAKPGGPEMRPARRARAAEAGGARVETRRTHGRLGQMTDLKACPFCSGNDIYSPATVTICRACGASSPPRRWNTRPIEEKLRAALGKINYEALNNMNTYGKHPSWEFIRVVCQEALK